jgi:hypothetical protein
MISYKEANRISIKAYLQTLNIHPAKEKNYYGMYHSPFREDHNASMKVDYNKNLWIDYGTGEGGTAIDLVMKIENCSFQTAISTLGCMNNQTNVLQYGCRTAGTYDRMAASTQRSSDVKTYVHQYDNTTDAFSFHREKPLATAVIQGKPAITIQKVTGITHPGLLDYLKERRIAQAIAKANCVEVHYTVNNKPYYAIGFENDSQGYELRNRYFKGCTSKDISSKISRRSEYENENFNSDSNLQSETCCLFEGFMDYLSFLTIQEKESQRHIATPSPIQTSAHSHNDVIVLNSLANLSKAIDVLSGYKRVSVFLDNDDAGQKAVQELQSICRNVDDRSFVYRGFKDLNEYLCGQGIDHKHQIPRKQHGFRL